MAGQSRRWKTHRVIAEATPLTERRCILAALAGRVERCTEDCPLLEEGACSLEALLETPSQPARTHGSNQKPRWAPISVQPDRTDDRQER